MNSLKNTVVTAILLAVGYGAYVVLNNPPTPLDQQFQEEEWGGPVEESEIAAAKANPDGLSSALAPKPTLTADNLEIDSSTARVEGEGLHRAPPASGGPSLPALPLPESSYPETDNPVSYFDNESDAASADDSYYATRADDVPPLDNASPGDGAASSDVNTASEELYEITDYSASSTSQPSAAEPTQSPNQSNAAFEATWLAVMEKLQQDRLGEALLDLSAWYADDSLSPSQAARCIETLDQLAGTVIYSNRSYLESAYQVQAAETLQTLAQRLRVPVEFLARINGLALPHTFQGGEYIKVVRGPFRAEISRSRQELTMFLGQYYAGRFRVQMGRDAPHHDAVYEVGERTLGRNFFDRRSGTEVSRDDPSNPYGGYWLGLRGDQVTTAHNVGIHSRRTDQPLDQADAGSISLSPGDAADVHAILSVGSRVVIRR